VGTSHLKTQYVPWELLFGYRAGNYLGFEVGYLHLDKQRGSMDLTAPFQASADAMQETDGFSILGRGALPVSRVFSVVANAGIYIWHIESTASSLAGQTAVSAVLDHRGVAPRMGLGIEAIVSARSTLRFEANMMRIHHQTTGVFSFNFVHYIGDGGS
jgi:OmpA-like transmembrane domain